MYSMIIIFVCVSIFANGHCEESAPSPGAAALVTKLKAGVSWFGEWSRTRDTVFANGHCEDSAPSPDAAALVVRLKTAVASIGGESRASDTVARLTACGDHAIPVICRALEDEGDRRVSCYLARSVAEMPDDAGPRALMDLYCRRPDLRSSIEAGFRGGRLEKGLSIGFTLSPEQMEALKDRIIGGTRFDARGVADLLAICHENRIDSLVAAMVVRYIDAIGPEEPAPTTMYHSFLYPYIVRLDSFLRAFKTIGERAVPALREAKKGEVPQHTDKWLSIALGYSKDPQSAGQLAEILKADPNPCVRYVAMEAYALSAGEAAIPLIETFRNDTTMRGSNDKAVPLLRQQALRLLERLRQPNTNVEYRHIGATPP